MVRSLWFGAALVASSFFVVVACSDPIPGPAAGLFDYQRLALLPVPGGTVHAAGGNGSIRRIDLSIDTRLGTQEIAATWNSATASWRWSFDVEFDGDQLVDASGASRRVAGLAAGDALAGTHWVFLDATTLRTKGGLVHEFTPEGQLARVRWASSTHPSLDLVRAGPGVSPVVRIDQCTAPGVCNLVAHVQRDSAGRVIRLVDRAGRQAEFAYDAVGRLVSARDALDVAQGWPGQRYEYAASRLSAVTNSEGERVEWEHDVDGRVTAVRAVGPGLPVWRFRYQRGGPFETELTDPVGAVTRIRWDAWRRVHARVNAEGETTTFEWAVLRSTATVAPDGRRVERSYADDDVVALRAPDGHVTALSYAPGAVDRDRPLQRPRLRIADSLGVIEEREYDLAGRLVEIRNGAGEATSFSYDAEEMLHRVTGPDGLAVTLSGYGEHGHATVWSHPAGTFHPTYDAVGNQRTGPDPGHEADPSLGGIVERRFDEDRNLAAVVVAEGTQNTPTLRTLALAHGSDGRRLAIYRPRGADALFSYDAFGRLAARADRRQGTLQTTTLERDLLGRPTAVERPNGMRQERDYDGVGRVIRHRILRDGVLESEATHVFEDGRPSRTDDTAWGGAETTAYDAFGRPAVVTHPGGEQRFLAYDARSRVVTETYWEPGSGQLFALEHGFDAAGRPDRLGLDGTPLLQHVTVGGRMDRIVYGNGLERSFRYAGDGELVASDTVDGAGQPVEATVLGSGCGFPYPLCHRVDTQTFGANAARSVETVQLLTATAAGPGSEGGARLDLDLVDDVSGALHQYDGLGNEVLRMRGESGCSGTWSYQYDAERSALLRADLSGCSSIAYTYDEAGYVTSRSGVPLDWDGAGRIRAHGADQFVWDTAGRPISRSVAGQTKTWRFGGRIEATPGGAPIALDTPEVRIDLAGGSHLYRHLDFRNQVKFVTDGSGAVVAHYSYHAYSLHEVKSGDPDLDPHRRFAQGPELGGLVLLGHRLLDPEVGRFLAPDPVYQLLNQHTYTTGNPYHYWDPGGLYQITVARALSIASLAFGVAALVVSSPALAIGLSITSVVLGVAALIVDASSDPSVVHGAQPEPRSECACIDGPGSEGRGRGSPGRLGSPGQLKVLEVSPDLGASLQGLGGFGFDFQLAGLIL